MKKTTLLSSLLALGISGLGSIANADETNINGGSENVDHYNGLVRSEVADQNTPQESATFRNVVSSRKAGGFWIRGIRGNLVVSDYKHYKKYGKGTAINGNGFVGSGGWKKPGLLSKGRVVKTWSNNQTFYDYK
ncbi:lactococcin 972 family bacteriocin [Staphylococcus sp. IVB6227]|nr:lactococcin 972 family bacteriocin [Staphylococcus sp. IVB6227]UXR78863.1 lactococcin 972 family bacteriocin [Staphylococcus sp. IVB6227]